MNEIIHSNYRLHGVLVTKEYKTKHPESQFSDVITEAEMRRISSFQSPPGILAYADIKNYSWTDLDSEASITLCLDGISDPGNLGTIIRTADWFGITNLVLSSDCADFYNAKVVAATMGSFTRARFVYGDLRDYLKNKASAGCFLDGIEINNFKPDFPLCLVIGSESHGISKEIEAVLGNRLTIRGYGQAESLNAGIAAGIVMERLIWKAHNQV